MFAFTIMTYEGQDDIYECNYKRASWQPENVGEI